MKALALAAVSFLFLASCGNNTVAAAPGDANAPAAAHKEGGCCKEGEGEACCEHGDAKSDKPAAAEKKGCCGACAPASKPKGDEKQ